MTEGHNILKSIVARIERLKDEQDALRDDIRDVYAEAKSQGLDKTALGTLISIRRKRAKDKTKFDEQDALVQTYMAALGMLPSHAHAREDQP